MSITDVKHTLAWHNSRVLKQFRDLSQTPASAVAGAMKNYLDHHKMGRPEESALTFYGLNHVMSWLAADKDEHEPLSSWEQHVASRYFGLSAREAVTVLYYLIWICTREARHNQSLNSDLPAIGKHFGAPVQEFFTAIHGGEEGISQKFLDNPPATSIGSYCDALLWVFMNSKWGSNYGGPKWGYVAECLCSFIYGRISAEMLLDTAWTLCHNTAPIFNKGVFFAPQTGLIYRILDVQRAGQIPEMVLHDPAVAGVAPSELKFTMEKARDRYPGRVGDYVDWFKVESLGSLKQYPAEKHAQLTAHPLTDEQKAGLSSDQKKVLAKQEGEALKAAMKLAEQKKTSLQITPTLWVPKFEIERELA